MVIFGEKKKGKILIVDDDQSVLEFLERFLLKKKYEVYVANNRQETIEIIKKKSPQVILLDVKMPALDEFTLLKEIKKINPEIGVIMIAAVQDENTALEAMKLGADDYISKPFDIEYLENSVLAKIVLMTG